MSPTLAWEVDFGVFKGFGVKMWWGKQPISHVGMLIMKTPIFKPCEFQSNFFLMNIECVLPFKPILLKCKGEQEATLCTTLANLSKFVE